MGWPIKCLFPPKLGVADFTLWLRSAKSWDGPGHSGHPSTYGPVRTFHNVLKINRQLENKYTRSGFTRDLLYLTLKTLLQLFSHERKLYTRPELATHRRKGDPDDSSHKGIHTFEIKIINTDVENQFHYVLFFIQVIHFANSAKHVT